MSQPDTSVVWCLKCLTRPATVNWGGTHDTVSLARNMSLVVRWCEHCVTEAQIAYARERAAAIPELEAKLARLP